MSTNWHSARAMWAIPTHIIRSASVSYAADCAGVDVVEVDNGRLRFTVVPDRGMGLWRAWLGDMQLGWQSPVKGPVHPLFVPLFEPSGIGWLQGFDELVSAAGWKATGRRSAAARANFSFRCTAASPTCRPTWSKCRSTAPAARSACGESSTKPASSVIACGWTRPSTTQADAPWLRVVDRVTNISGEPADLELLYHINLGSPLLAPGSKLHAPIRELAPRDKPFGHGHFHLGDYVEPQAGSREFAHFAQLASDQQGQTVVLLELPGGEQGVSLAFNHRQLPCFTLWKSQRMPGDGYVTGLEPGINFPNTKSFEQQQGRVVRLEPGETRQFEFELHAHDNADAVRKAAAKVATLGRPDYAANPYQPKPEWSRVTSN